MISLYFHIPFCKKKCPYCHFYVIPDTEKHKHLYLEAIEKEWQLQKDKIHGKEILSIYFGGGTPSRFPEAAGAILSWIKRDIGYKNPEITFEVNPEDVTEGLVSYLSDIGINRISLGVQSFNTDELITLGRTKSSPVRAILQIYEKIKNISIDLMYDVPRQTDNSFQKSLDSLSKLPISHLSLYNLTIEPHTSFYKSKPVQPKEEESLKMLESACTKLEEMGLHRYEISAFAKEGFESNHNIGYWTARPFLGFGPSSFSYYDGARLQNVPNILRYKRMLDEKVLPITFSEKLEYRHAMREKLGVELRLLKGVDLDQFEQREGTLDQDTRDSLQKLQDLGLITYDKRARLTPKGTLFYDSAMSILI